MCVFMTLAGLCVVYVSLIFFFSVGLAEDWCSAQTGPAADFHEWGCPHPSGGDTAGVCIWGEITCTCTCMHIQCTCTEYTCKTHACMHVTLMTCNSLCQLPFGYYVTYCLNDIHKHVNVQYVRQSDFAYIYCFKDSACTYGLLASTAFIPL